MNGKLQSTVYCPLSFVVASFSEEHMERGNIAGRAKNIVRVVQRSLAPRKWNCLGTTGYIESPSTISSDDVRAESYISFSNCLNSHYARAVG